MRADDRDSFEESIKVDAQAKISGCSATGNVRLPVQSGAWKRVRIFTVFMFSVLCEWLGMCLCCFQGTRLGQRV
jgi:hypothetical protein